jgi:hypothetical protein
MAEEDVRIGVTIMHHPFRAGRIPALVDACAPLEPQVVVDPDPAGVPSPLRTAKRAWAQIDDRATHHLVLQDDIVLAKGFAGHLGRAVAQRPMHAISLYSHWDSPHNSYLIRRAAAAGSAWAPLSTAEWTPTQGLVLPVEHARELAKYLAEIPDEIQDDDEMVVIFCRERGIPVVATVPHLVDHCAGPTIVGHAGTFHATVFTAEPSLPSGHWSTSLRAESALGRRCAPGCARGHTVELRDSRCALRFVRPGSGEPVEHRFAWYWYDWSPAIGVDPGPLLRACQRYLERHAPRLPVALATEVWAAGYLLGADVPADGRQRAGRTDLIRLAMASWIASGLSAADRTACDATMRAALEDLGIAAIAAGRERRG